MKLLLQIQRSTFLVEFDNFGIKICPWIFHLASSSREDPVSTQSHLEQKSMMHDQAQVKSRRGVPHFCVGATNNRQKTVVKLTVA